MDKLAEGLTLEMLPEGLYRMIAEAYGLRFLDAGTLTQMSALDGEHLDPDGHKKLAAAIADRKSTRLNSSHT